MRRYARLLPLLIIGLICSTLDADDIYVSPDGSSDGDGSKSAPLDLLTALSSGTGPAKPGDRILLMPGRYDGPMKDIERLPFVVGVSGTFDRPIRIMPLPSTPSHAAPHLNGTIELSTSYVHIIGLEIGDLRWDRYQETHRNASALHTSNGQGSKVINCNFFGGRMGSGVWKRARNFEMYGCLIHDYGTMSRKGGRGHGHAVYTQNIEGTKTFRHNAFYRGCGWNFDIYTQAGDIDGYDVIENVSFIGGYYKPGQVSFSYGVAGFVSADRIRFIRNLAYQPRDAERWRGNTRMIRHGERVPSHGRGEFIGNTVIGAYRGFSADRWEHLVIRDNTIWATGLHLEIASAPGGSGIKNREIGKPDLSRYDVDGNTYIANGQQTPFRYGAGMEIKSIEDLPDGEALTFEQWQALGLDKSGRMIEGNNGYPTGTMSFVFPNDYEPGRALVSVFNFDGDERVSVDLSEVLKKGQAYRVYNLLDINQTIAAADPIARGQFDGQPVKLPTKRAEACPKFEPYLLLPE